MRLLRYTLYLVILLLSSLPQARGAEPIPRAVRISRPPAFRTSAIQDRDAAAPQKDFRGVASAPGPDRAAPRLLTLRDCIEIALKRNFGLGIRELDVSSAHMDLAIARAVFEPDFFARGGKEYSPSILGGDDFDFARYQVGFTGRLPTGASVELAGEGIRVEQYDGLISRVARARDNDLREVAKEQKRRSDKAYQESERERKLAGRPKDPEPEPLPPVRDLLIPRSFNPTYATEVGLTLRQPLLKDAGFRINLMPITLGKINVRQAELEQRRSVLNVVRDIELAWWSVVFAYREKELSQKTYELALRLVSESKARGDVGLATDLDVLQAETAVTARKEALIVSDQAIDDRMDELLLVMAQLGVAEHRIVVPDSTPSIKVPELSNAEALAIVRAQPEYRIQLKSIEARKLLIHRARNECLPTLDVTLGGGYVGRDSSFDRALGAGYRGDQQNWGLFVEMRIPLGFRAERANLAKARHRLTEDELRRDELEQQFLLQIREAVRAVIAGAERTVVTSAFQRRSEEQFQQILAKYKEGVNTSFRDALRAEEDLDEARLRDLRANLDVIRAAIRLARLDGTLLSRHNLLWEE